MTNSQTPAAPAPNTGRATPTQTRIEIVHFIHDELDWWRPDLVSSTGKQGNRDTKGHPCLHRTQA
jgi:hypothetical protein